MALRYRQLLFTPSVRDQQASTYGAAQELGDDAPPDALGEVEAEFIASRDSFYVASVGETGWPYVQHRGGPPGFLRVVDAHMIAFADLRGNRQLISRGNLAGNDRVALILMDYPRRSRLKLIGHARVVARDEASPAVLAALDSKLAQRAERIVVIDVVGFDWNCPQHITPRFTEAEVEAYVAPLRARIAELEARLTKADSP